LHQGMLHVREFRGAAKVIHDGVVVLAQLAGNLGAAVELGQEYRLIPLGYVGRFAVPVGAVGLLPVFPSHTGKVTKLTNLVKYFPPLSGGIDGVISPPTRGL